ncbi:MAG: glycosyltransferase family 4 protein [Armatimonadota bacterium]
MNHCVKLVHITTVPVSLNFIRGQAEYMKSRGFEVHAVSSPGKELEKFGVGENISVYSVTMPRAITPLRDIIAIARICRTLRKIRPRIVHSHTPKGGLLGTISAWIVHVPVRIYHIHGLPMLTARGYRRVLLRWSEKVACMLAHRVLCVSHSIRDVAVAEGLCPAHKIKVLLNGSINGFDAQVQFNPARYGEAVRAQVRSRNGIPGEAMVVGFVGRMVRDKGLIELVDAWRMLSEEFANLFMLIVGDFEPQDPVPPETAIALKEDTRIILAGNVNDVPGEYLAMDVIALPTYREGFPQVPMEAACMQLPVVATDIPGCRDAVVDGVTGTLVPARDAIALADAIRRYITDPDLRKKHGQAGRERVLRDFRREDMWEATHEEYLRLLKHGEYREVWRDDQARV